MQNVDLSVGDIASRSIGSLSPETTASNFGKVTTKTRDEDQALGIINMVFQTIGVTAVFAAKSAGVTNIVLTGKLTNLPQTKTIFDELAGFFGVNFLIPKNAEYATAIGAAISSYKQT